MSISYSIEMWSSVSMEETARIVANSMGFQVDPRHGGREPRVPTITLTGDGFDIDVRDAAASATDVCLEELGLETNQSILLFPGPGFTTMSEAARSMVSLVCVLTEAFNGDLVFLFSGEQVLLVRDRTGIVVSDSAGFWTDHTIAALSVPYAIGRLPSI